jgi:hypothetical protein
MRFLVAEPRCKCLAPDSGEALRQAVATLDSQGIMLYERAYYIFWIYTVNFRK